MKACVEFDFQLYPCHTLKNWQLSSFYTLKIPISPTKSLKILVNGVVKGEE